MHIWAWRKLLKKWKHRCAYCGIRPSSLTRDHVVPRSRGGKNTIDNIVPCCTECNNSKKFHDWQKWYREQPFYRPERENRIMRHITKYENDKAS